MKSRDSLPILGLCVGIAVAALIACGVPHNPFGPNAGAGIGPSSVPIGPSASPIGPSARPQGPSSRPQGPGTGPQGPSSAPGGGGGPTPTPSPSPTPGGGGGSASPPTTCPFQTVTFNAANTTPSQLPFTSQGGNFQGPVITVDGSLFPNCRLRGVRVAVAATAANLADLGSSWVLRFDHPGAGPIGFDLIRISGTPLTGTQLGTSCGSLQFVDGGPDFDPDAAPYTGMFRPAGVSGSGTPSFQEYLGKPLGGDYGLYPAFLSNNTSLTMTCYVVEFDLE